MKNSCQRNTIILTAYILGQALLFGCNSNIEPTLPTDTPAATSFIDSTITSSATRQPTITPSFEIDPTITDETLPVIPQFTDRALLIQVSEIKDPRTPGEVLPERVRNEIWILDQDSTTPKMLLRSDQYSFDVPVWSHDGEWIAYIQRDSHKNEIRIGVIHKDGTDQRTYENESAGYSPLWSWDDRMLTFVGPGPTGRTAYSLDVNTGELQTLNPDSNSQYSMIWLSPSPQEDIAFLTTLDLENKSQPLEMWLVPIDGQGDSVRLPPKPWSRCNGIISMDWASDGKSFLIQEGMVNTDTAPSGELVLLPTEICKPLIIWQYDLVSSSWSKVAEPPNDSSRFESLLHIDWSPDGLWVAWEDAFTVLIFDPETWNIVREVKINGNQSSMYGVWMSDSAGNSILAIAESDYAQELETYNLLGFSPNGTEQEDRLMTQILRDPEWLPNTDNYFYVPNAWQP